jgi:hypothetical protein
MRKIAVLFCLANAWCLAQEAESGFELRTTVSSAAMYSHRLSESPRNGAPITAGFRSMLYPTWKLNKNWTVAAAVQVHSRPYFVEQLNTQGYGLKTDILQAHLGYSRFWNDKSLVVRVGQLSSAFGSFLLRYDDAANPLIDMPSSYGYYYKGVTSHGLTGAQVDVTWKKMDARAQFVNSSPANRRSLFDRDQYGNWAGGIGFTPMQGLRVGASAYYGPYLHREYRYFFEGETRPRDLPAKAFGIDAQWSRGHWNANGELHWFHRPYRAIANYAESASYGELRRVLHPRWYVAARVGQADSSVSSMKTIVEAAVGFRPNSRHLIKVGMQTPYGSNVRSFLGSVFAIQFVATLRPISIVRD